MTRYVTRGAYFDDRAGEFIVQPEHVTVTEGDGLVDTGLLDAAGRVIYRTDRVAMGFRARPRVRVPAGGRRC